MTTEWNQMLICFPPIKHLENIFTNYWRISYNLFDHFHLSLPTTPPRSTPTSVSSSNSVIIIIIIIIFKIIISP